MGYGKGKGKGKSYGGYNSGSGKSYGKGGDKGKSYIAKEVTKEVTKAKAKEKIRAAEVSISRETPRALLSLSVIAIIVDCEATQAGTAHQLGANMRTMGPVENAESMGTRWRYAPSS